MRLATLLGLTICVSPIMFHLLDSPVRHKLEAPSISLIQDVPSLNLRQEGVRERADRQLDY